MTGTLHIKKFRENEAVTTTAHSKKHGYLYLIGTRVLANGIVLAHYGRLK